jgi:hypothetical protein
MLLASVASMLSHLRLQLCVVGKVDDKMLHRKSLLLSGDKDFDVL